MTTYTLQPAAGIDAMIGALNPTTNYGASTSLISGEETGVASDVFRALLKFDLSSIPTSEIVVSATLTLTLIEDRSDNVRIKRVFRSKRAWTEAGVTWNKYDGTNNWQTAGGFGADDCEQTAIGDTSFTAAETIPSTKDFSLTPSAIQAMIDGSFANNGFLIKTDTELDDAYNFASSDHATAGYRPKLVIVTQDKTPVMVPLYQNQSRITAARLGL